MQIWLVPKRKRIFAGMDFLADVNVLVALVHARHSASKSAIVWLERQKQPTNILLCRVAQMGVFRMVNEPLRLEDEWRLMTRDYPIGQRAETDTYLAAFARAGGYRLVTFDGGFRKFKDLTLELIEENAAPTSPD